MRKFLAAASLAVLASCSGSVDPATAKAEVEQLVKVYHEAYDRADADAVIGMLDPEVAISRPHENRFVHGRDACAEQLRKDMDKLKDQGKVGKRKTFFETIRVDVTGPLAIATYATLVKDDGPTAGGLFTRVFRYDASTKRWLIYREHY